MSFTKESDLHFELKPYLAGRPRWIADWYKLRLIRVVEESRAIDPLKRHIFPTPVYLHTGGHSPAWSLTRDEAAGLIARACAPDGFRERMAAIAASVLAPDLWLALERNAATKIGQISWLWLHRRFVWQRVKEKLGLAPGRSRVDDGRDWLTPAVGPMHPIWTIRVVILWAWRLVWRRSKE